MLPTPTALLLDFGGVIVESGRSPRPEDSTYRHAALVQRVHRLTGGVVGEDQIRHALDEAKKSRAQMRENTEECLEISHEQLWGELIAVEWPAVARATVLVHASDLTRQWARRPDWRLRPGISDLLDFTVGRGMQVAVVSNTPCGQAHREALDEFGLTGAIAVQVYSDELGVYKPHPSMIWAAARDLDVPVADCWYVGDQPHRDIVCARRAGVGAAILMPEGEPREVGENTPDAVVADGTELLALLRQAL
ncbi:HAD family hydrolase [Catellatospora paridis]|uniref:HAD family hydrolase n=1 Tax=Catellatospora paridis TaxID=1617086 RepID=UPI0012D47643|nr:HAD family hydrolase [Catellatospora paridis]